MSPMVRRSAGFTLIELLLVVAIIGIIAAIGIPNLLRSRMSANQAGAAGALKTIATGQVDYFNSAKANKTYAYSLDILGDPAQNSGNVPILDAATRTGVRSGYTFYMVAGAYNAGSYHAWSCAAWPLAYRRTGTFSMYIDNSGLIRQQDRNGAIGTIEMFQLE